MDKDKEGQAFVSQWILISTCSVMALIFSIKMCSCKKKNERNSEFPTNLKTIPKIPGAYPLIGHGLQLAKDLPVFLQRCFKTHGGIFRIQMFKWNAVMISDFEIWKAIIAAPDEQLSSRAYSASLPVKIGTMGDSNIFSAKIQRTPVKKSISFHPSLIPEIQEEAQLMVDRIKSKYATSLNSCEAVFDVHTEVLEYVCDSFTRANFGFKLDSEGFKSTVELKSRITMLMQIAPLVPERILNIITEKYTGKIRDKLHSSFQKQIDNFRTDPSINNTGFMQECVDFKDKKTGESLTDNEICGVISAFAYVGLEAAVLLTNLIADLVLNPTWLEQAAKECRSYLETRNYQAFLESPLIDALVWESARINSGGISQVKAVLKDNVIVDGYSVGDADIIALCGPLVLEAAGYTDLPKFDPTRFYGSKGKELVRMLSAIIFSSGPTFCTGKHLVITQVKLGLAQLLASIDINIEMTVVSERLPGASAMLKRNVTLAGKFI